MERTHFDELIGREKFEEMMDSLQDHILSKKIFANMKPIRFCPQRYLVMVAIPTIVWMFLEEKKYIKKGTRNKFEGKNGYYHIAKLECVSVLLILTSVLHH